MPKYEVDVGGKTYEVDAPDSNTAWQWANYTHTQAPAAPKESTFGSELVRGAKQLVSSARTGVGSVFDPEEAAKAGVARSQAIGEEAGVGPSLEAVQKAYQDKGVLSAAGEAVSQIPLVVRLVPQVRFSPSLWVLTLSAKLLSKWKKAKTSVLTAQKPIPLPQAKPH